MKNPVKIGVVVAISLTIFAACNKDEDPVGILPAPATGNSLTTLFSTNLSLATQTFSVDAATGGSIYGSKGTTVYFSPNAFVDANGDPVTGMVDVELVESPKIGDMIWLNKQTVGMNGGQAEPLISGGQIYLNASQSGNDLSLIPTGSFVRMVDDTPDPQMVLFGGTVDSEGTIIWNPFANNAGVQIDSSSYNFPNDSLGWINCDYFNSWSGSLSDVMITVPSTYDDMNTLVWVAFPTINSLTNVYTFNNGVFELSGGYQVPVGMDIVIVALHDTGNNTFESSFTPVTVTAGMNQTITFQSTTLTQFQADCNSL